MHSTLVVNSWVGIHEGCDMAYRLHNDEGVYVTLSGTTNEPFELFIEKEALRQFGALVGTALAELDSGVAQGA
jgi:hypothetical protein